jgi:hypothetical protein
MIMFRTTLFLSPFIFQAGLIAAAPQVPVSGQPVQQLAAPSAAPFPQNVSVQSPKLAQAPKQFEGPKQAQVPAQSPWQGLVPKQAQVPTQNPWQGLVPKQGQVPKLDSKPQQLVQPAVVPRPPIAGIGAIWKPRAGDKFQIVLGDKILKLDPTIPLVPDAEIFDVDLFHTPQSVIKELNRRGKKIICYFSAGGSESWRPDYSQLKPKDIGDKMAEWKGEKWLNIKSPDVWAIMEARIKYAYEKGCNAIDPDNL